MMAAVGINTQETIMRRSAVAAGSILVATVLAFSLSLAIAQEDDDDDGDAVLGAVVKNAPVSLQQGFAASSKEGRPISGKFEFEVDGAQLSVYTAKDAAYSEVIVDHRSGRIAKVIPIVDGNDLIAARKQAEMTRQAQRSLEEVTESALKNHRGYHAVSATPGLKDGSNMVKVVLTNGNEWKTVYEPLVVEEVDW
jgi:hypothetical protein